MYGRSFDSLNYTEDRIVTDIHSWQDPRRPEARAAGVDFGNFNCRRSKPTSLLAKMRLIQHPTPVNDATASQLP